MLVDDVTISLRWYVVEDRKCASTCRYGLCSTCYNNNRAPCRACWSTQVRYIRVPHSSCRTSAACLSLLPAILMRFFGLKNLCSRLLCYPKKQCRRELELWRLFEDYKIFSFEVLVVMSCGARFARGLLRCLLMVVRQFIWAFIWIQPKNNKSDTESSREGQ